MKSNQLYFLRTLLLGLIFQAGNAMALNVVLDPTPPFSFEGSCDRVELNFTLRGIVELTKTIDAIAPCDIGILVLEDTSFTGIMALNFEEGVRNDSGIPWHDFHFMIGTGRGDRFVPARPPSGDPTDLFFADGIVIGGSVASSDRFDLVGTAPNQLDFLAPIDLLFGEVAAFDFTVFVPVVEGEARFTLRQIPTVIPEPTSIALVALGLVGLVLCRRK